MHDVSLTRRASVDCDRDVLVFVVFGSWFVGGACPSSSLFVETPIDVFQNLLSISVAVTLRRLPKLLLGAHA